MRHPARFRTETKYAKATEEKANVNLPIMAVVGDRAGAAAVIAVPNKNNFYWIRLLNDPNRVTQCFCPTLALSAHDVIYVAKAKDRNLSWYEFVAFVQDANAETGPPICPKFAQVVYVSANACHFATLGAAVAYIKGLPAASRPAAGQEFMIEIQAGTYTETGDIDLPAAVALTHTHIRGQGEATIVNMVGFELTLNDDCSMESLIITGTGAGSGQLVLITGDRVVMREVRVKLTAGNDCVEINGAADAELNHVILETTTIGTVGFYITNSTVSMWDCDANDSTRFWPALLIGHTANPSTVTTRYCTFRAAAANNDVWVDANCTWQHFACQFDPGNISINAAATETPLSHGRTYIYDVSRIGNPGAGNYSEFEADGTLEFVGTATVWNDIYFPTTTGKLGGANQPTWTAFQGNTYEYTFAINDYIHLPSQEISHSYREGSNITLHCHIVLNGSDVGNTDVNYEIEYTIGDLNETMSAAAVVTSGDYTIPGGTADRTHLYIAIGTIVGATYLIQAALKMRFRRIALVGGGNAPSNDPFVLMVGAHIEEDTVGSRAETTK